ncbi:MAG: DEAD/DEAH box helicase [Verrucomicrobiales bacterium]|nr:DEAD/DEAH box helicase [Verrucomicrobiales bacterium]
MDLTTEEIAGFISRGDWKSAFEGGAVSAGAKLARAKQIQQVAGEFLETGDAEITAVVIGKDGSEARPAVVFWSEGENLVFEGDCNCAQKVNCVHAAAIFDYLTKGKGARVEAAFGGTPEVEKVIESQAEIQTGAELFAELPKNDPKDPKFILRVERRPANDELAWLPEVYAKTWVVYGEKRVPLTTGNQLKRNWQKESQAVGRLDSLGLRPGAEEPPQSLKKLDLSGIGGPLWAPDKQRFPHPKLFWQKFWVEWGPQLEKAGWDVQYASNIQIRPIHFRTENWCAEIVEEGKGWFHLSAGFEVDGETFDLQPILAALVRNHFLENTAKKPPGQEFLVFLPDGRGITVPIGRFRKILLTLGELLDFKFTDGPVKLNKMDAALLAAAAEESDEETDLPLDIPQEVIDLSERLADFKAIERVPVPDGLQATLREYQLDGYHWMQFLITHGLNGILADDMGLGKTLQTLTHILAEKETGRNDGLPSLVLAPTSVVENWQREGAKFTPGLSILILQGAERKRKFRRIPDHDIVMTSYALVYRDLEELKKHEYHLLALDEAQHIKNTAARTTRAVAQIDARHRLCLSGTPIENNLGELWSLMNFLMPGFLGTRELFQSNYRNPIEKDKSKARSESLAKRVGPLILRRTKNDVAKELPPKTEIPHSIELNSDQKDLYETVRSTMDRHVRAALKEQGKENQMVFLEALLKLRQICCHPHLLDKQEGSAKFDYLVELLDTLRQEKHRILIFSQFTSMLSLIESHLNSMDCSYLKLTGETKDRQSLVERFQGGEGEVFLISLKAGGTGLTLTGADTVIHYDPWWNPAVEDQATDRAYRIGQDKPVFVHKLICKGTVEDKIQKMQRKKSNIAEGLLSGATQGLTLTPDVLNELFAPVL